MLNLVQSGSLFLSLVDGVDVESVGGGGWLPEALDVPGSLGCSIREASADVMF